MSESFHRHRVCSPRPPQRERKLAAVDVACWGLLRLYWCVCCRLSEHDAALEALLNGTVEATSGPPPWLHGNIGKGAAAELVSSRGDGAFLVWERKLSPAQYGLTVKHKGNPTHHLLAEVPAAAGKVKHWTINKKAYGEHKSWTALVKTLMQPNTDGWPARLTDPVKVLPGAAKPTSWGTGATAPGRDSLKLAAPTAAITRATPTLKIAAPAATKADEVAVTVTIKRGNGQSGYGFKFDTSKKHGSFISEVDATGAAADSKLMKVGQQILSIDGTAVGGMKKVCGGQNILIL
jgi:hypothetical protein